MQDDALYNSIKKGKEEALTALFEKYFQRLCFFAGEITGSTAIAEEVVADVFIKLWENRRKTHISHVRAYLYKSVKNKALKHVDPYPSSRSLPLEIPDNTNMETRTIKKEQLQEVLEVINKMPPQQRQVFEFKRFHNLKYKEIASVMNLSVHTVQNHMVMAIKFMHDNLPANRFID
tara:strand:- start:13079 stop:13606 length:528 start_codon:yes stop_codon:yes gene_type:complete